MNLTSLCLMLALCGQAEPRKTDARDVAPADDIDSAIEAADEKPSIGEEPAAATAPASKSAGQKAAVPAADAPLVETHNVATNAATPDALMAWLGQGDTSLDGKGVTLADLLSRIYDRAQQALVIPAYWKLSAAEFDYRIAADESARLAQLLPPADASGKHPSDSLLEARLAAAEARLREAELAVISQQHVLADLMRLPTSEPMPLCGDLPHAGAYRTYFQERYVRSAPPRAHLMDRTLPLLHRSIELRASAAQSAADSVQAGTEAFHAGQLDLAATVDSIAELTRQRRAFVAAVRDYNMDIADYALSVVPAGLTGAQLVSILIGPPPTAQRAPPADPKQAAAQRGGVNPAAYNAPLFAPAGQPTLAPTRSLPNLPSAGEGGSAIAPPAGQLRRAPLPNGAMPGQNGNRPRRIKSSPPGSNTRRAGPARYLAAKPPLLTAGTEQQAAVQPQTNSEAPAAPQVAADQGVYTGLGDLTPVKRAQELSATLHWANSADSSAEPLGLAATLIDALNASAGLDRRALIQAYWRTCEELAALQVTKQEAELLRRLESAALRLRQQPGGAEAMLHLHTSQLASQAAIEECMAGLLNAQFALAQLMRRPLEGPWPLPTTAPHAGGYRLKLDAQPATLLQSTVVRQIATTLPLEHEVLQARANAVVNADAARVETALGVEAGQRSLNEAVDAVQYLVEETLAFLDMQTTYNLAFADYVIAVAPPGTSAATLAGVLVVSTR